jgi:hypothetical protein
MVEAARHTPLPLPKPAIPDETDKNAAKKDGAKAKPAEPSKDGVKADAKPAASSAANSPAKPDTTSAVGKDKPVADKPAADAKKPPAQAAQPAPKSKAKPRT